MHRHLWVWVGFTLVTFIWGCESDIPSDSMIIKQRESAISTGSASDTASEIEAVSVENTSECRPKPHCNPESLSALPPSPEPSGTPVLLTADAACAPDPAVEYRFLYKPIDNGHCDGSGDDHGDGGRHGCGQWIELRGWGESTFLFDTTGVNPGRYLLRAQSRTHHGHGDDGSHRTIIYEFTEACAPGYHSDGAGNCVDIDECLTDNGGCDPLTVCTNTPGSRECGPCPDGYDGTGDTGCVDIDECLTDNGGCDPLTVCTNTPGSRECGPCPEGYDGTGEEGCVDIDECLTDNGGCDPLTVCTNTPGSRECGPCPDGYIGTGEEGCVDIDECLTDNGGCDPLTTCTNTPGSRECSPCPEGYDGTGDTTCMVIFVASEMVGRPTDSSITINAMAIRAVEAYFEYGTAPGEHIGATSPMDFSDGIIETVINGLSPDTRYYYRMRYRPSTSPTPFLAGSEYTFHTRRPPCSTFTFGVQSDSHQNNSSFYSDALYRITMGNILNEAPDFLLDLGDMIATDNTTETETTVREKYLNQRNVFDIAAHSVPVFLALGNHENEEGWNLDDMGEDRSNSLPVLGGNARKRYFLNPVPDYFYSGNSDPLPELDGDQLREDYYAFEWGNALFVVIDPFAYTMKKPFAGTTGGEKNDEIVGNRWDWTLGTEQYLWLKQTLESSTAKFKFVFTHQMTGGTSDYVRAGALGAKYCEWGGYNIDGVTWAFDSRRPGWEMPIHQLFVHTNVSAFFHGHDHVFAEEVLDGVVYQEVPHAANPDYGGGFSTNPTDYAGGILVNNSGHLRVTVSPTNVTVDYVRSYLPDDGTNGETAYSYEILPCEERDSDGDGFADCSDIDGCPGDAAKVAPGVCGCGKADTDSDGDGTLDCLDLCPNDPLKVEIGLCGCGRDDSVGCDRFMVVRVGDGSSALTVSSTAAFLEERRLDDGTLLNTTPLPTEASGDHYPLTLAGSAYAEGTLKRAVDGQYLTMAGYGAAPGLSNVAQTAGTVVNRVVARISSDHTVDTTTAFTGAFSGTSGNNANDRAAVTYDGSAFWVAGTGTSNTGGIWYIPFGSAASGTQITGQVDNNPGNVRTCGIFNDQLYAATNSSPFYGVFTVGAGLPTESAAAVILPGFPTSGSSSPMDFAVMDRDPIIDGADTIYLADDRVKASGGGIQKWTYDGAAWTLAYTLNTGLTTGVRHLLAVETPDGVLLLAGTTTTPNSIVKVIDTGSGSSAATLITAATNTAFRGIALSTVE